MCGLKMTIHVVFYCAGTAASLSLPESARRGCREGKTLKRRVLFGFLVPLCFMIFCISPPFRLLVFKMFFRNSLYT